MNDSRIVEKITAYIEAHLEEDLSLDRISGELHYSRFYISRLFAEKAGCTIYKYIGGREAGGNEKAHSGNCLRGRLYLPAGIYAGFPPGIFLYAPGISKERRILSEAGKARHESGKRIFLRR